jgi:hypothetical protein
MRHLVYDGILEKGEGRRSHSGCVLPAPFSGLRRSLFSKKGVSTGSPCVGNFAAWFSERNA